MEDGGEGGGDKTETFNFTKERNIIKAEQTDERRTKVTKKKLQKKEETP